MSARAAYIQSLAHIRSRDAVQLALDHPLDMLRISKSDEHLGVRKWVPGLFLRLDRDQDAYDFIKWWHYEEAHAGFDWSDMSQPWCGLHNHDAAEPMGEIFKWMSGSCVLAHVGMLCLIKLRLSLDLQDVAQHIDIAGGRLSQAALDKLPLLALKSAMKTNRDLRQDVTEGKDLQVHVMMAELMARGLFIIVMHDLNKYYWDALLQPDSHIDEFPTWAADGSREEAQIALHQALYAWQEAPGAMDWLEGQMQNYRDNFKG